MGTRAVPFSRELYIEGEDFSEDPPKKYKRLSPGREVRLRNSYVIKFAGLVKDEKTGEATEVHCTYDPDTRNSPPPDGRKVEGVIHWVSANHAVSAEVRLYDRLFRVADPTEVGDEPAEYLNPGSLETLSSCCVEPALANASPGSKYQFERLGYFCADSKDSLPGKPVFNRVAQLRDSWGKIASQGKG
jgi:glutaminyl-tRNA synthetase